MPNLTTLFQVEVERFYVQVWSIMSQFELLCVIRMQMAESVE